MRIFKKGKDLHNYLAQQVKTGKKTGFVPTMGALHAGHLVLAETCKAQNDISVSSIFVNPTQFNNSVDFEKYPITLEKDIYLLEKTGCDVLFIPTVKEIYPNGLQPTREYELGDLEDKLEGKFRPGHFQGVCQVVHRLLDTILPHQLYLGQKDYQQTLVIARLIHMLGYQKKTRLVVCPTLREADGLAMSSRNQRLNPQERKTATTIFETLSYIKHNMHVKEPGELKSYAVKKLTEKGFVVDYVEIADTSTLDPILSWKDSLQPIALIAAFLNEVRLIDNLVLWQDS